ncbi:hypothetical protein RFI_31999, partial [Reticulomyxa filosa]
DDLLFITYYPKNIKIANLNDISEIHQNKIEIACNNYNLGYHCFEKLEKNKFILFCNNAEMSIEYNEFKNKISYEERLIVVILIFLWTKCNFTLPMELSSSLAIFSDHNAKIRIIGEQNNNEEVKIHHKEKVIQLKSKLEKLDKEEEKIDLNKIEWLEIWCSDGSFKNIQERLSYNIKNISNDIGELIQNNTFINVYFHINLYIFTYLYKEIDDTK